MRRRREKVLIVNEDVSYLHSIVDALRDEVSITILNNIEVVERELKNEEYAVIISESGRKSLCGFKTLELASKLAPDTIKMIISNDFTIEDTLEATNKYQVFRFLYKNTPLNEFILAIKEALISYKIKSELVHINEKTIKGFLYIPIDILHNLRHQAFDLSIQIGKFAKLHKQRLPIKDFWSFEVSCLMMFTGSLTTNLADVTEIYKTENLVKTLKHSADLTESIPLLKSVSKTLSELAALYEYKQKVINLSRDSEVLKIILDYFALQKSDNFYQNLTKLYTVDLIKFIIALSKSSNNQNNRTLSVNELEVGMIAAENYGTDTGSILVKKGEQINLDNLSALLLFEAIKPTKTKYKIQG